MKNTAIAARIAHPCRIWPTIRPKAKTVETGMSKIAQISRKLVQALGFSNGCAALALKKPPPLVPSSLMISWLATGPIEMVCFAPSMVVASTAPASVCGMPRATNTSAPTTEIGRRI